MHFGTPEIVGIVVIVLLLFGAKKLPELGRSLGQGIKEFRKSSKDILEDKDEDKDAESESDSAT